MHPKYTTTYRVGNWAEYDRALVRRGDVTLWLTPDAIATWAAAGVGRRSGQLQYSDLAIETALTLSLLFHELPWPRQVLADLGERQVTLRVTLSYFVEPNPARRGWRARHRYASHGLRFDVKTGEESSVDFRRRLNKQATTDDAEKPMTSSDSAEWLLGDQLRHHGSLHCDICRGDAAKLAERGLIGVYPVKGWWQEQPKRDRSAFGARYALIVSIQTDAEGVDIWTPVAQQLGIPIQAIEVEL